jgi:hypothetical protein
LDIKTDRNWEGVIRPTEKSGELFSSGVRVSPEGLGKG